MEQINTCNVLCRGGGKKKLEVFFPQKSRRYLLGGGDKALKNPIFEWTLSYYEENLFEPLHRNLYLKAVDLSFPERLNDSLKTQWQSHMWLSG